MIKITLEADTKKEIERKRQECYDRWPTRGYSTRLDPPKEQNDGTWISIGYRFASCD